jgi:hypothetical protein
MPRRKPETNPAAARERVLAVALSMLRSGQATFHGPLQVARASLRTRMTPERMAELVARWVRVYTRNLPVPIARRRIDEIDADLHDHIAHERARGEPTMVARPRRTRDSLHIAAATRGDADHG